MELRLLRYFLAIAEEESITRAAEVLHITQPALSRQLAQLENELGCELFRRGKKRMALTDKGMLLRRRATEILELADMACDEIKSGEQVEGKISIGMGELASANVLSSIMASFCRLHPRVTFDLFTGVADQVSERLDRGLVDFGLFLEPVDKEKYRFARLSVPERWVAVMAPNDPLAQKSSLTVDDLAKRTLALPSRPGVQSEIARWFGNAFDTLDTRFTCNLATNGGIMVSKGLAVMVCVEGAVAHWDPARFAYRPLEPAVSGQTVVAWKRGLAHSHASAAFVEHLEQRLESF